jgi:very-short-patch-repair endonuclease
MSGRSSARWQAVAADGAPGSCECCSEDGGDAITRSELEERFLALCRDASLPRPAVNVRVETNGSAHEVDFLWREQRVVAETDGWGPHHTRAAFESDRRRDADLLVAGFWVVRFTWRQVTREPERVAATLRTILDAA